MWLRKLWRKYMKGAEANNIPIKEAGLFGGKIKNPTNLKEAMDALDLILGHEDKRVFGEVGEEKVNAMFHHSLGRHLRNKWGLWDEKSELRQWFKRRGIWHPDDMSGIIITSYYRDIHHSYIKLDEQIKHYLDYWKDQPKQETKEEVEK